MTAARALLARSCLAGLLLALPHAAHAAPLAGGAGATVSPWRVIAALVLCLALAAAAIFVLRRRYGPGGVAMPGGLPARRMRLIEQQALGPQRSLSLVEIEGRRFAALIAPGAAALVPLDPAPDAAPDAATDATTDQAPASGPQAASAPPPPASARRIRPSAPLCAAKIAR